MKFSYANIVKSNKKVNESIIQPNQSKQIDTIDKNQIFKEY